MFSTTNLKKSPLDSYFCNMSVVKRFRHSVRINYKLSIELTSSNYLPLPLRMELETVATEISAASTE